MGKLERVKDWIIFTKNHDKTTPQVITHCEDVQEALQEVRTMTVVEASAICDAARLEHEEISKDLDACGESYKSELELKRCRTCEEIAWKIRQIKDIKFDSK